MGTSLAVQFGGPYSATQLAGTGRFRDFSFPEPAYLQGSLSQTVAGQRQAAVGATAAPLFAKSVYTADPGSPTGPVAFNGVSVMAILSGAAAGQSFACGCLCPRLNPSAITVDEFAYTRIIWIMALGNPPSGAATDVGGWVVPFASATPDMRSVAGGISGFGFQFQSMSQVQFFTRGPNGLVTTAIPAMTDVNLHAYELRILPPTRTQYAQLQAFLDGAPIALPALSSSWAPGTNLMPLAISANRVGFAPGVINNCGASANLLVQAHKTIVAPTFADLF